MLCFFLFFFFFFNDTATTEIYTLSLHDALPISPGRPRPAKPTQRRPANSSHTRPDCQTLATPASARRRHRAKLATAICNQTLCAWHTAHKAQLVVRCEHRWLGCGSCGRRRRRVPRPGPGPGGRTDRRRFGHGDRAGLVPSLAPGRSSPGGPACLDAALSEPMTMIEFRGLTKLFVPTVAVDDLTAHVASRSPPFGITNGILRM